jgi:putative transposase
VCVRVCSAVICYVIVPDVDVDPGLVMTPCGSGVLIPALVVPENLAVRVGHPAQLRNRVCQCSKLIFAVAQRFFRLLPNGDVLHDARHSDRRAILDASGPASRPDPADGAVSPADSTLKFPIRARMAKILEQLENQKAAMMEFRMKNGNHWAGLLAYVTGLINQELLLQNEYLAAENRILRAHLPARLRLSDPERYTLAEIGKRLGRKALEKVACVAKPDTILAWYRRLIARKFDGSQCRTYPGRPRISAVVEQLVVRFARENSGWGYDRIVGALANLGHHISDQTVGNILRRHDIAPAPKRSQTTTWKEFIRRHMNVLAGTDFFTVEVLTWRGLVTYYVLFFLHLETRRVSLAGITRHPTEEWMTQMARNAVDDEAGYLLRHRYVLHDRDTKFCAEFRESLAAGGVKCLQLPPRSPNLNAFAERWVRSVKSECLSHFILFGEGSLRRALKNFCEHYHGERNHQGKANQLLFPRPARAKCTSGGVRCQQRLGGLLKYYYQEAA